MTFLKNYQRKAFNVSLQVPLIDWGLRDYGLEPLVWGGDGDCEHGWGDELKKESQPISGKTGLHKNGRKVEITPKYRETLDAMTPPPSQGQFCQLCNAWRGSLGLEPTPELYVRHLVEIFRLVKRVLRDDGTVWLNMGDSYATHASKRSGQFGKEIKEGFDDIFRNRKTPASEMGLKEKDLIGIPWRLAFALQADGWYLRSDIIWSKPNPMPESCTDRPTKAHEYVFLLSKKAKYFYDADAVREPHLRDWSNETIGGALKPGGSYTLDCQTPTAHIRTLNQPQLNPAGRNKRTVWEIATQPTSIPHFAAFPEKLVEPCILAGTSEKGCCPECGSPWERVVNYKANYEKRETAHAPRSEPSKVDSTGWKPPTIEQKGWQPTCKHDHKPTPCTVLDPFAGTGTVGKVARDHFRKSILIDIKQEYNDMAVKRFKEEVFDFA